MALREGLLRCSRRWEKQGWSRRSKSATILYRCVFLDCSYTRIKLIRAKVLAVHPDYLLREAITEYMRQRWFNLTIDGHHAVVVGLLRERQFEMALNHLDVTASQGIQVESWLYDMAIYMLCDVEEVDEALRIIQQRTEAGEQKISKSVWYGLLDVASSTYHVRDAHILLKATR